MFQSFFYFRKIHNHEISHVKHVSAPFCVFFRAARSVAGLLAEDAPLPPPAGAEGGAGTSGLVPVLPVRHVPGSHLRPHGRRSRGPRGPRGLCVPGQAAVAAMQPLPLGRVCWPPPGGCYPQPTAPSAGCPAWLAVAPRLRLGLGHVGTGGGRDAGAIRRILGRVGPRLRGLCGVGAPGPPGSPSAAYVPAAWGTGPNRAQGGSAGRSPPCSGHTAMRGTLGAVSLPPPLGRRCAPFSPWEPACAPA